ncbi:MAG TPA: diguanylate cyclase [Alphaproteobacteria bacterium]|nr:diguanylate cyclase [Alphaproteobacteria bacterium]
MLLRPDMRARPQADAAPLRLQPVAHAASGQIAGYDVLADAADGAWALLLDLQATLPPGLRPTLFVPAALWRTALGGGPPEALAAAAAARGLDAATLCLELLRDDPLPPDLFPERWARIGLGPDGSVMGIGRLYSRAPRFVRFGYEMIEGLATDRRRHVLVSRLAELAGALGAAAMAEGLAAPRDFYLARDAGCTLAAGPLLAPPEPCIEPGRGPLETVRALIRDDRRRRAGDAGRIDDALEPLPALPLDTPIAEVLPVFRAHPEWAALPVVDGWGRPVGVLPELSIKAYAYAPFGHELIKNKALGKSLAPLVEPCAVAERQAPLATILDRFAAGSRQHGVIIVDDLRYCGFLGAAALLSLLAEKDLAAARDQNPLTRLPGNSRIAAWLGEVLTRPEEPAALVYFDIDWFKPFNDRFGFRIGDRAILLLADVLREGLAEGMAGEGRLLGHIGGDDFFAGFGGAAAAAVTPRIAALLAKAADSLGSLFDAESRRRGWYEGHDRDGRPRRFPLLRVSAVVLDLPAGRAPHGAEAVAALLAGGKERAKQAADGLWIGRLGA